MFAEATATFHSNADAAITEVAVKSVLADDKSKTLGQSPDGTQINFATKKTLWN